MSCHNTQIIKSCVCVRHEGSGSAQGAKRTNRVEKGMGLGSIHSEFAASLYENILRGPSMLYRERTLVKMKNNFLS